ncbi:MAG: DNA polymerase III subunit alpha [Cytophagales bacterium]|nr:DNA polymerase III subunit alpha [Cytophagales bacterium]
MYLIFDTETTGLPKSFSAPHTDLDNWPRLVQLAWELHGSKGELINAGNYIVKPEGFTIPFNAEKVHGISTQRALEEGHPLSEVLEIFQKDIARSELLIGHNIEFDLNVMGAEFLRGEVETSMWETKEYCTKLETTDFVQIPGGRGGKYKWPTLTELHTKIFGVPFDDAHDAAYDVMATSKCFFGLIEQRWFTPLHDVPFEEVIYEAPELEEANFAKTTVSTDNIGGNEEDAKKIKGTFSHLHVHTQFSILQSTTNIDALISKVQELEMPAVAMTDHGNMMGAFLFVRKAIKAGIKPIVGCEFYVAVDRKRTQFTKHEPDKRFNQTLIAKNKNGYLNLAKLSSLGYMEGLYGLYPRIDKDLIKEYKEDVIALTGNLQGEIPNLILNVGENEAEQAFLWWLEVFGDNFYVELIRHGLDEENHVNRILLQLARKYNVKVLASNDVYYNTKNDADNHDILLCVRDGELQKTPIGRGRGFRFGFPNQEYYLKSSEEMKLLFSDIPDAINNIQDLVEQCEVYPLEHDVLLPAFDIPDEFKDDKDLEDGGKRGENNYLRHLTYVGAKKRYGEDLSKDITERLDFELEVIAKTGYPGYFLIVQDFTTQAKKMGVLVGPGRGSAAGSVVAYCVGITNVDPIKYDLLFERFLNPDRVSMPDIDIDFDDDGRGRIIDWVVNKYGRSQVAQIITYGTMAAKSSVRDTARVLDMSLQEANAITKLIPDIKLGKLFKLDDDALADKLKNKAEDIHNANELKRLSQGDDLAATVINKARALEGSMRNTGIHACGVIITPDDITKFVPVSYTKGNTLINTQFDNSVVEDAGLLKMDFLGLKTLTLIRDACRYAKETQGVDLDPDNFPIDDKETYELFQRGETVGIFQYESAGMQKYMKELKPTVFADLIAMNALYRPGPLEYIPSFIRRKHGTEPIIYDIEASSKYLKETYGITVYQEQVMLLSQLLADFTKGEADTLRKAMGKKKLDLLAELKPKFLNQGEGNGHNREKLEKVWTDWEAFASYAFNKSHSTCYAWIAYQTAFLKAHYPAEYMASVLSNNMNNIKSVTFFMEECERMGIPVLGPDVNESQIKFSVNGKGEIRFGLGAIKGTGEAAVGAIITERGENGAFKDIFDFAERINLRQVNKKTFESLAQAGGFDCFKGFHRRQYLEALGDGGSLTEIVIKYANKIQEEKNSSQTSLFGGGSMDIPRPKIPSISPFQNMEQLKLEKEVVGLYISGHPLDQYKLELKEFCTCKFNQLHLFQNKEASVGGIVTNVREGQTKNGKPYGVITVEDYGGKTEMFMMGDFYLKNKMFLGLESFVFMKGRIEMDWRKKNEVMNNPYATVKEEDWKFSPQRISPLNQLKQQFCKGVLLKLDIKNLDNMVIDELLALFEEHRGSHNLELEVYHEDTILSMNSRKFSVDINSKFVNALDELPLTYNILS